MKLYAGLFCLFILIPLEGFGQNYILGDLGQVSGVRVVTGWAFETTYPTNSINVAMYIDGGFIANAPTTILRTDVNSYYGITGIHGFSWTIPTNYNNNTVHTLNIYGLSVDHTENGPLSNTPYQFVNHEPIGDLGGVNSTDGVVTGWAFDQDQGSNEITVAFYIDNPAGEGGRNIGSVVANIYNAGVDSTYAYLGITGNHGFSWTLPSEYMNAYHMIYPYAIDSYVTEGIGTGINPLVSSAPQAFGTRPSGNESIASMVAGQQLMLQTSDWAAGAITSLTWNGTQFVYSPDYGTDMQSAISFYQDFVTSEYFNPTEAGSLTDGSAGSSSSSVLQAISTNSNPPSISTQTQMAQWELGDCSYCSSTSPSEIVLNKEVVLGYNGYNNVIGDTVTFNVPTPDEYPYGYSEYQDGLFEALTGYMPSAFTVGWSYSPVVGAFTNISLTQEGHYAYPVMFSGPGELSALGVFCPDLFSNWALYPQLSFGTPEYSFYPLVVPKWNVAFRYTNGVPPGLYTFHFAMPIGSAASVQLALAALYRQSETFEFGTTSDWWKGESNALDSVGANNGTATNITYEEGVLGYAFDFNGTSSDVNFGANAGNFGTNDFMIDLWLQTSVSGTLQSLIGKRPSCGDCNMFDVRIQTDGDIVVVLCQDTSGTAYANLASSEAINDGKWHEVTIQRVRLNLYMYIDGVLNNSTTTSAIADIQNTTALIAGKSACVGHDGTAYFDGLIDEIRIGTLSR